MSDLDELIRRAVDRLQTHHHGVVVAALAGETTEIQGTAGLDRDTRFEIGSVTKVFTALTLARLAEAGSVSLDQPLRDFLPAPDGITLRHLATHTAGLPRLPTGMLLTALLRPNTPDPYVECTEDFLIRALARTKPAPPGRKVKYSNFGAGLLGLALARHTGLSYERLVAREIGEPLGLTGTSITGEPIQGHRANRKPAAPWHLADLAGAGGLRSTATDLVALLRAHLVPAFPAVEIALGVEQKVNPFVTMRLGWMSRRLHPKQGGHLQIFHNGQTGGFFSFAGFDPEKQVGVVVLSDTARSVDAVAFDLLAGLQSRA